MKGGKGSAGEFAIFDLLPEPVVAVDADLKVTYANGAFLALVGRTAKQVKGTPVTSLLGTEDGQVEDAFSTTSGAKVTIHTTVNRKQLYLECATAPLPGAEEGAGGVVGIIRDKTDLALVTGAIRDLAAKVEAGDLFARANLNGEGGDCAGVIEDVNRVVATLVGYLNAVPAPVMIIDKDFSIRFINRAGAAILGLSPEQLCGQKCYSHFKTSDCNTPNCACARAMAMGSVQKHETDARPAGQDLFIHYTGAPVRDRDGKIIGAVEIVMDKTDVRNAIEDARAKVDYLNKIPTTVMVVDKDFTVRFMNPAGAAAVGRTPEACIGEKCYNLFNTGHCNTPDCRVAKAMRQNGVFTGDTVAKLPSGELPIRYTGAPLKDEKGNIIGALEYVLDISKEMEITKEMLSLAEAALEGRLSERADAAKFEGNYQRIVQGVNDILDAVLKPITEATKCLEEMARGNLDVAVTGDYKGDHAIIKNALNTTIDSFNEVLSEVVAAVDQVAGGSQQLAATSQQLSQAATETAGTLEETTASMQQMASQTKLNADNAAQANQLATRAKESAENGNQQMAEMVRAMGEINEAATNISKIIKAIEEIAFQTNLLALNAAVEAARAGKHGKGFTVVAEEVRNLAQRSAKAAKETAELIEDSIKRTEVGTRIATETAKALEEIVLNVTKVTDLVGEIASACKEQAMGIEQISRGLSQVDQATQENTASAEELAATSEELSSQALHLQQMLERFKLKKRQELVGALKDLPAGLTPEILAALQKFLRKQGAGEAATPSRNRSGKRTEAKSAQRVRPESVIALDDREFGKF
ncbi:methyl-accepting chemotaxis sensory transducer with Pas/Pac sensor [Thermodesulfitimonas autotrophica]|uniref:Methyl-accepting chemotaxis sensory transducer with Pas/Pac sensor n=1 Tax=Thermodesulfitimonas autotrophica TaxID=1894989 RepID=A0A3N5AY88_9THEO|nr:methyl-accepting chemotaxis protein [Thermodesulfitimonas autotrophica]RPF49937.1 methyl-accepting chemotaxis sensory transducer with Pas/Pac sensor [Thermodesulfitimonas autotrophica]